MVLWIAFGALIVALTVGFVALFRSFRRWSLPAPTTPEAKQAEAELWSTRNLPQR